MKVIAASNAPVDFDVVDNIVDKLTPEALASARRTGCTLKGEFVTGVGRGTKPSINVDLRKSLSLYANVVHSFNVPGITSRHEDVDIVIVRENMEGEFSGMEHEVVPGVTESLKIMTRDATRRIAHYAFEYAFLNNRSKVTAVHKVRGVGEWGAGGWGLGGGGGSLFAWMCVRFSTGWRPVCSRSHALAPEPPFHLPTPFSPAPQPPTPLYPHLCRPTL